MNAGIVEGVREAVADAPPEIVAVYLYGSHRDMEPIRRLYRRISA